MVEGKMDTVKEKSTAYVTVSFYDRNAVLADPQSAMYEIHDFESGTELQEETAFDTTDGVGEITLTKIHNTLVDDTKYKESRKLTVHAVYGAADELHDEFVYEVIGLEHVSSEA